MCEIPFFFDYNPNTMATRYINRKTSRLYSNETGYSYDFVLIYGEEVQTQSASNNGRTKVRYRNKYEGFVNTEDLKTGRELEVYFIDVGQGDAAFIVTPNDTKILIDGGYNERARGFLAWKYHLANENSPDLVIDLLILSHADGDHLGGLLPILQHDKIKVKQIIHNGIGLFKNMDEKSGDLSPNEEFLTTYHSALADLDGFTLRNEFEDWINLVQQKGITYQAVHQGTGIFDVGDPEIKIEILGPRLNMHEGAPQLKWFGNHSHTINGHSVMFKLTYDDVSMLFSGDMNIEGAEYLMEDHNLTAKLAAHVFKTPHHGSHEFYTPFFEAIRPQISVVSSGDSPDHGHPRANFLGAIGLASRSSAPLLFSTEIAGAFVDVNAADLRNIIPAGALRQVDLESIRFFKRQLHGMINVRTDGRQLFAMRRVSASYQWEAYGPLDLAPFPSIFGS